MKDTTHTMRFVVKKLEEVRLMRACFGILLIALFSFAALAQAAKPEGSRPKPVPHGLRGTARELNLNDRQKNEIEALVRTERQQRQAIRESLSLTPEQKRDQLRELRHASHDRVLATLTPEQQRQFQQRHQHVSGIGPLAQLNLTADQKARIAPILRAHREQSRSVLADSSLTPDQKRAKLQDIRRLTNSQIGTVLSPNQRQRLQQFKEHRGNASPQTPDATHPANF